MKRFNDGTLAALLLGAALFAATPAALAEDPPAATDNVGAQPAEVSRVRAADAHAEAVSKAAEAVLSATRLELDIRLVSHTSVQVASDLR